MAREEGSLPEQASLAEMFADIVGADHVLVGSAVKGDYRHDEALTEDPQAPLAVACPNTTDEVAGLLRVADENGIPVTARGAGTGLSGAAVPEPNGIVVSFERMNRILEVDEENFVAVVEPGVQLDQLDAELAARDLVYPVFPGEYSASLGGNINTNAGGMRAVKYGVTRQNVLGLEAVLPSGEVVTSGGKVVKVSSAYDLTQLLVGSEGTLALTTKAYLRLYPRLAHQVTVLAPFTTLDEVTRAVPEVVASGADPLILEYIDMLTMAAATAHVGLDLGISEEVRSRALAYLVVSLESPRADRLEEDVQAVSERLADLGAIDVYVLPAAAAGQLIDAREKAFWVAKANGADDVIDVVIPRGAIPEFMAKVSELASEHESWVAGCGHAGDGNVHMAVFQPDPDARSALLTDLFEAGMDMGGAISGEHGLGRAKRPYYLQLEDPAKLRLMRRIKTAFDPNGILNPSVSL